jgi:fused signal recognition particle receptor
LSKPHDRSDNGLNRYLDGYNRTSRSLAGKLTELFGGTTAIDDALLEELLVVLIEADVGVQTSEKIIDRLKEKIASEFITTRQGALDALRQVMTEVYDPAGDGPVNVQHGRPNLIMMVGVNGSGKTTSIAKLTAYYRKQGYSVGLIAADTFRAGAVEQLDRWAQRLSVPCISGKPEADPASVIVDGCRYYRDHPVEIILADTAGRLQTKANLMKELEKMTRVAGKQIPGAPQEVWLSVDATTGQNGLSQAEGFLESAQLTGVVLTKMDGTSKGGIALAIKDQYHLPVRFITYGEDLDSLTEFWLEGYLETLIEEETDR